VDTPSFRRASPLKYVQLVDVSTIFPVHPLQPDTVTNSSKLLCSLLQCVSAAVYLFACCTTAISSLSWTLTTTFLSTLNDVTYTPTKSDCYGNLPTSNIAPGNRPRYPTPPLYEDMHRMHCQPVINFAHSHQEAQIDSPLYASPWRHSKSTYGFINLFIIKHHPNAADTARYFSRSSIYPETNS